MFSVRQKREIAEKVQQLLRSTGHPELPASEIQFLLHVDGAEAWSWADIRNNGAVTNPDVNPHNEGQDGGVVTHDPATAAIEFALSRDCECPMDFLRCWNEGDFDAIRKEWPGAPWAVFVGADPSIVCGSTC